MSARAWIRHLLCCAVITAAAGGRHVTAGDWPQILGPERNGIAAADERLADAWPADGPPVVWRRPVGSGFSGVAVVGTRVVLFHRDDDREVVEVLDAATGASVWSDGHATTFRPQVGGGDGPLCVPLVHDGAVVTFGAGDAVGACPRQRRATLGTPDPSGVRRSRGILRAGSTPVVAGGRVVVNVGGSRRQAGIVAFDLGSGETAWQATDEQASYSAPVAVERDGVPHVLMVTRLACLLVDATDGTVRWTTPFGQRGPTVNAATPLVLPGGRLFLTASYGIGSVCAAFDRAGITPVWQGVEPLASQYCTPIQLDGSLYCVDGRDDLPPAALECVDAATGRLRWTEPSVGYGTLIAADGKLVVVQSDGMILLVRADPERADVLARASSAWDGPCAAGISAGRLYLRDDRELVCLDLAP